MGRVRDGCGFSIVAEGEVSLWVFRTCDPQKTLGPQLIVQYLNICNNCIVVTFLLEVIKCPNEQLKGKGVYSGFHFQGTVHHG